MSSAPASQRLTTSSEDQDFPTIAQSEDAISVAYLEFRHSDRDAQGERRALQAEPKNFDLRKRRAGGQSSYHSVRYEQPGREPVWVSRIWIRYE